MPPGNVVGVGQDDRRKRNVSSSNSNNKLNKSSSFSSSSPSATGDRDDTAKLYQGVRRLVRRRKHQFYLLPVLTRSIFTLLGMLLVFSITTRIYDSSHPVYQASLLSSTLPSNNTSFAVVINTFRRPDLLQKAVVHYAETCGRSTGIESVYIIWAEEGVTPPLPDSFFPSTKETINNKKTRDKRINRSYVNIHPVKDSLNNRFQPIRITSENEHLFQSATSSSSREVPDAVFMVDDDMEIDCHSLSLAFKAWKMTPDSMVGFYPRLAALPRGYENQHLRKSSNTNVTEWVYHAWPMVYVRQQINFVLTKACFLHKRYMDLYMSPDIHPIEILQYVEENKNCEDVAMSMLVANVTRYEKYQSQNKDQPLALIPPARPIYVESRSVIDRGMFRGISTNTGHMKRRSECLTELTQIYNKYGWDVSPFEYAFDLQQSSYRQHLFWWQIHPSHLLEWIALANFFH